MRFSYFSSALQFRLAIKHCFIGGPHENDLNRQISNEYDYI